MQERETTTCGGWSPIALKNFSGLVVCYFQLQFKLQKISLYTNEKSSHKQGKEVEQVVHSLVQYKVKKNISNDSHELFELSWLALC